MKLKLSALAILMAVVASPARAESVVIGCPLIEQYSEDQVHSLLSQARAVLSEQEIGKIYHKYVSLRSDCQVNGAARRVVQVSPTLRSWLAENGVDIRTLGNRL